MEFLRDWKVWVVVIIIIFIVLWIYIKVSDPTLTSTEPLTDQPEIVTWNSEKDNQDNTSSPKHAAPVVSSLREDARYDVEVQLTEEEIDITEQRASERKLPSGQSVGEKECAKVFCELFGAENMVYQTRDLKWLENPKTRRRLELDGYCPKHRIAFEYNGRQHYEVVPHFHPYGERSLHYQQWKDNVKVDLCDKNGVYLITVPYWVKKEEIRGYIIKELPRSQV